MAADFTHTVSGTRHDDEAASGYSLKNLPQIMVTPPTPEQPPVPLPVNIATPATQKVTVGYASPPSSHCPPDERFQPKTSTSNVEASSTSDSYSASMSPSSHAELVPTTNIVGSGLSAGPNDGDVPLANAPSAAHTPWAPQNGAVNVGVMVPEIQQFHGVEARQDNFFQANPLPSQPASSVPYPSHAMEEEDTVAPYSPQYDLHAHFQAASGPSGTPWPSAEQPQQAAAFSSYAMSFAPVYDQHHTSQVPFGAFQDPSQGASSVAGPSEQQLSGTPTLMNTGRKSTGTYTMVVILVPTLRRACRLEPVTLSFKATSSRPTASNQLAACLLNSQLITRVERCQMTGRTTGLAIGSQKSRRVLLMMPPPGARVSFHLPQQRPLCRIP